MESKINTHDIGYNYWVILKIQVQQRDLILHIIIALVVIAISIICIIITVMIVFISVRYFSPRYKNNTSADIALREGHTTSHGQVMCEETGQVHYSTVQNNVDDPSEQTN